MRAKPYLACFRARFLVMLQYRTAAVAGFGTQCWWGLIKVMVFAAFFYSSSRRQPMTLPQAVTYVWLGQAFLALLPWNGDPDIAEMVRSGNVAYERLRPLDTYFFWYTRAIAWTTARVMPRAAMMFAFAVLLIPLCGFDPWRLRLPEGVGAGAMFAAAMTCTVLLSGAMVMLINLVTVATMTDTGPNILAASMVTVLSGSIVPLLFFPAWMHVALFIQPFAGLVDIPYRIYFGNLHGWGAIAGLVQQTVWTVILVCLGHRIMARTMSQLQVQGG
jgi:viologen exporter family transport system permease protein